MQHFPYKVNIRTMVRMLTDQATEDQWIRELAQNSFDAGATEIAFDFILKNGHEFTRVSDNGHGMSSSKLIDRITALSDPQRDDNYGIGGRVASLKVSSHVAWASKLAGQQPFAVVATQNGLVPFQLGTSSSIDSSIIPGRPPATGELSPIAKDHGTSVVFYGDGKSSTWGKIKPRTIAQTLMQRYYTFGEEREGHKVDVRVYDWNKGDNKEDYNRPLKCMKEMLAMYSQHAGTVTLDDGTEILWHVLKETEKKKEGGLQNLIGGGNICVLDGWELHEYPANPRPRLKLFGVYGDRAPRRTFLIVKPVAGQVKPDMHRTRLELVVRKNARASLPWKAWGDAFSNARPAEIEELLPKADINSVLSEDFKLPPEWYDEGVVETYSVTTKAKDGKPAVASTVRVVSTADRSGPPNPNPTPRPTPDHPPRRSKKQQVDTERFVATEDPNGTARAVPKHARLPSPSIILVKKENWPSEDPYVTPYDFEYQEHGWRKDNTKGPVLLVKETGRAIRKQTRNWVRKRKDLPNDSVASIVAWTYAQEISAKIVDFQMNGSKSGGWPAEHVDEMLSPPNLTFAAEGHWAIDLLIEKNLKAEAMRLITSLDDAAE